MSFSDDEIERYARHLILKEIGGAGQQKLKKAHVTLVGLGGLGGPAALYLAAAGVGHLRLVDADTVSLSNLQRQVQFESEDLNRHKVRATAQRIHAINPHVMVEVVEQTFHPDHVHATDLVLDGTDDFTARFVINAAAVSARIPLVSGALGSWTAQVGVFAGHQDYTPCYRCYVPDIPPDAETCARLGVVGALAGVAGTMMALEAIKMITGAGRSLLGRLWLFDGLGGTSRVVDVPKDPNCTVCGSH